MNKVGIIQVNYLKVFLAFLLINLQLTPCATSIVGTSLEFTVLIFLVYLLTERSSLPTAFSNMNKSDGLLSKKVLLFCPKMLMSTNINPFYLQSLFALAELNFIDPNLNIFSSSGFSLSPLLITDILDISGQSCIICKPQHKKHYIGFFSFSIPLGWFLGFLFLLYSFPLPPLLPFSSLLFLSYYSSWSPLPLLISLGQEDSKLSFIGLSSTKDSVLTITLVAL